MASLSVSAQSSPGDRPVSRQAPWLLLWSVAALPALIAVVQLGRLHPDEVYQVLEPAYRRAFGYGTVAWEWQTGLRNWALPGFFSLLLRASSALGLHHPVAYRAVLELPQFLLHGWMLVAIYRYGARRLSPRAAAWATSAVGLYGPVLAFAGRTLGESISTSFLVIALERLDRPDARARCGVEAGALLGLAVVVRYGSAVPVLAAVLWLLLHRRFRLTAAVVGGGAAVAMALGALDAWTWGAPFHSLKAYVAFNLLSGSAAKQFGEAGPTFYLGLLFVFAPLWSWPGTVWACGKQRPSVPLPLFCAALYLGALLFTAHKEARFLYPGLVLWAMAAAPGAFGALAAMRRVDLGAALSSLAVMASLSLWFVPGPFQVERSDQFHAIVEATRPEEATGLLIVGEGVWGAGGSFYIGKDIPWRTCDFATDPAFQNAMTDRRFNRAVTYDGRARAELESAGFRALRQLDRATVFARP